MRNGPTLSFAARFSGRCAAECGKPICVGEQVTHRGPKQTRHLACDPLGIDGRNPLLRDHLDVEINGFAGGEYTRSMARNMVLNEYLHAQEYGPYRCHCGGLAWYKATFGACRCVECGDLCMADGWDDDLKIHWPKGDPNEPIAVMS